MIVHLPHCVVRGRLYANPKREAMSYIVSILRELFHVVNRMITKSLRLFSDILRVRFLVLMNTPKRARVQEHVVLKLLHMEIGLWRTCKSS